MTQRTRYKKQSGGHGQFGEVEITFKPSRDYDKPYIFKEEVFGGAVPRTYFPAVEKGLIESVKAGCLGGYPVLGIEATLIDGAYHSVKWPLRLQHLCASRKRCLRQSLHYLNHI